MNPLTWLTLMDEAFAEVPGRGDSLFFARAVHVDVLVCLLSIGASSLTTFVLNIVSPATPPPTIAKKTLKKILQHMTMGVRCQEWEDCVSNDIKQPNHWPVQHER